MPKGIYKHKPWTPELRANRAKAFQSSRVIAGLVAGGKSRTMEANGNWKGDDATSRQTHLWLIYNLMCYSCHMKLDHASKRKEGIWIKKYEHSKYIRIN